jgi:uncharacterized RmlC-like cupin family protein
VRPPEASVARQELGYFQGISAQRVGATILAMHVARIPPGVQRQPVNLSHTEPVLAVVARNDPNEHQVVVLYDLAADALKRASAKG